MRKIFTPVLILLAFCAQALDPAHFTINRVTAPYFIVDGNSPATINKAYVGFEIINNSNSATTYSGLKFTINSISTSVSGQNFSVVSPASGIINIGTLTPGQSKVCYFYVQYPAHTTAQGTFNITLSDLTASTKTGSYMIRNRSSISANAGGTATQTITNQDMIGATVIDDVTYVVGNVQSGDENDFQVAVSSQFDPTKVTLLSTQVTASSVPLINVGSTDSLYFISGNGSNGATVTVRFTFRITGFNFTTYLLPCAGATSGGSNYKYALNTALGNGTPITVSAAGNPLTITKSSDKSVYGINSPAVFTITIQNNGAYPVSIDKITDELPTAFSFQSIDVTSGVTATNSTSKPNNGATGTITFEGGVSSGANNSYTIPNGGSIILKYSATTGPTTTSNLLTTVRFYVGTTEVGSATNTVRVSATLPVTLTSFKATRLAEMVRIDWATSQELNTNVFELERALGNGNFMKIASINAAGASTSVIPYSYTDSLPALGRNSYRLKIIDRDQRYSYSPVAFVNFAYETGIKLDKIYPNPVADQTTLYVLSSIDQKVNIEILDLFGRVVMTTNKNCVKGGNEILLTDLNTLNAGTYVVQLHSKLGTEISKLVKQR